MKLAKYSLAALSIVAMVISVASPLARVSAWTAADAPVSYSTFIPAGAGGITYSNQMAFDSSGNFYAMGDNYLQKYDSAGVLQGNVGGNYGPTGVAFAANGDILIVDYQNDLIKRYTSAGSFITQFGGTGSGNTQFSSPYAIAIDSSGYIYVADATNNRVQKFNNAHVYQSTITSGNGTAFGFLEGVAVDGSDNVYVLDSDHNRVQKFNSSGVFQLEITGNGGAWNYPEGMTVDSSGNVYVSDPQAGTAGTGQIQIFDTNGTFLQSITSAGTEGAFTGYVTGIAVHPTTGDIYFNEGTKVVRYHNDRVVPSVSITPLASDTTSDLTPTFSGTATDALTALTEIQFSIDNESYYPCDADDLAIDELSETFTCTVSSDLGLGAHNIKVRSTDSRTNINTGGSIASYDFTVATSSAPTVTTGSVSGITGASATVGGNVTSDGGDAITERGMVYSSTQAVPTTSDSYQTTTGTTGVMSVGLSDLTEGTHYYVRAYATNGVGTSYGSVVEFDTTSAAVSPTVTTGVSSGIGETTATVAGNVTSDGGATVTERGIVYSSTATTPTTANSKQTTTGTTGVMSVNLSGLSRATTYYARAYAINSQGTSYGSVVTFKTLEPAVLRNVYFTFAKLKYNQTYTNTVIKAGDTAYLKNYNPSQLKLLQVFLYDYAKHGNQGFSKSNVTTQSMFLRSTSLLPKGKRYAYVMKFQDKATGLIATKYFVFYTKN